MDLWKISLVILLLLLLINLTADEKEIYHKLLEFYDNIVTYQADFVQTNYWSEPDISQTSRGKIFYDKSSLLLKYSQPEGQYLLADSSRVIIYDRSKKQAFVSPSDSLSIKPIKLIKKYWEKGNKKKVTDKEIIIQSKNETVTIKLANWLVYEMQLIDSDDNRVKYQFKHEQLNKSLPKDIFFLDLPSDVNIIDSRN